ncbi:MAG: glycosyltransferase family 2 protein [Actinomycetota bacterium]|nr:glycosyltransferase family 2 protein [Actinomycetota bacterium]
MSMYAPSDVSAVVCTMNSITSIAQCLASLRAAGVGELIVVDAHSTDGTQEIAESVADQVLSDPGSGLGNARNVGIAQSTRALVLNMGSDNVIAADQLQLMIDDLMKLDVQGVSARTEIAGASYSARGLNAWRKGRFVPGPSLVIGTPTLFLGDLLRANPYDSTTRFSDDSELCERWAAQFGARFAISTAAVQELGKTSWEEIAVRCRMYGISDHEIYSRGVKSGWPVTRRLQSAAHPLKVDLVEPLTRLSPAEAVYAAPFLASFTGMRYLAWAKAAIKERTSAH